MVNLLFDNGANVNLSGPANESPLNLAISLGKAESLRIFLDSETDNYEFVPGVLGSAARQGHLEIFEILIGQGFELEKGYKSALGSAIGSNELNVVKLLVANDVEISKPLHYAIQSKSSEMLKFLISTGSDVNEISTEGDAPLHLTAARRLTEATKILIDSGADLNIKNAEGQTPLDIAIAQNHSEIADLLRAAGASQSP
jgi:ankyrin repeat protein